MLTHPSSPYPIAAMQKYFQTLSPQDNWELYEALVRSGAFSPSDDCTDLTDPVLVIPDGGLAFLMRTSTSLFSLSPFVPAIDTSTTNEVPQKEEYDDQDPDDHFGLIESKGTEGFDKVARVTKAYLNWSRAYIWAMRYETLPLPETDDEVQATICRFFGS